MKNEGFWGLVCFVVAISSIFLRAFVFQRLWGWFFVPFFTLTTPNFVLCMGISTILHLVFAVPGIQMSLSEDNFNVELITKFEIDSLDVNSHVKKQLQILRSFADKTYVLEIKKTIIAVISNPLIALSMGWVLHHFL